MKTSVLAIAASALLASAEAGSLLRRHAHANAHLKLDRRDYGYQDTNTETCKVVTYTTWVPYTAPPAPKTYDHTTYVQSTVTVVPVPSSSSSSSSTTSSCPLTTITPTYSYPVPTPDVTTCPTPGTYTFPAKTITLTQTATVCVPTTTVLPPGTHTYGYTTTVVATSTHVTCPYATTYTSSSAVYTTITSTIYTCPSGGTYTYGGFSTTIAETKTIQYPVATTYTPGTYTHAQSTVTVTGTITEYTCPYAPYVTPAPVKTTPKVETYAPPAYTTKAAAPPAYTTKAAPPSVYESPKPKPTKATTHHVDYNNIGNGKQWGMTYTQYKNDKSCKSRDQIFADIKEIAGKGFRTIRVYAPDCDALPHISDACEAYGLTIVLGVFIRGGDAGYADVYKQVESICTWGKWSLVEMLVIGNEAVFGGIISSSELAGLISGCRSHFSAAGYKGPITTSEVVAIIQENPGLCAVIDVVGVNIQPFFNGGYASDAGNFLQSQLQLASQACGGKTTYCLEAGWPSAGSKMGNAVASPEAQQQAIESIYKSDSGHICYHSKDNDGWKDATLNGGVEQHFGCSNLFPVAGGYQ